jgi:hypothetical protein
LISRFAKLTHRLARVVAIFTVAGATSCCLPAKAFTHGLDWVLTVDINRKVSACDHS